MSKYYVVCGSHSLVMAAPSADHAAMRLIDEVLAAHAWIYNDVDLDDQSRRDHLVLEALLHLDSSVHVSERGLGRSDGGIFGVPELIDQWHELMVGLSRLFVLAGLAPRQVLPAPQIEGDGPKRPR